MHVKCKKDLRKLNRAVKNISKSAVSLLAHMVYLFLICLMLPGLRTIYLCF